MQRKHVDIERFTKSSIESVDKRIHDYNVYCTITDTQICCHSSIVEFWGSIQTSENHVPFAITEQLRNMCTFGVKSILDRSICFRPSLGILVYYKLLQEK